MSAVRIALIALSLQLIAGCAHYYTPSPSIPFETIVEFSSTGSVTLINDQPSTTQVPFHNSFYANLNAWTGVAITIAERELIKRGLHVVSNSSKTLKLAIVSAHTEVGWVGITSQITMNVRASDGYEATYVGTNTAYMAANIQRQIDGALMRAVLAMFKDQHIVEFLKN